MQITACETDFFNNKIILESQQKIKKKRILPISFYWKTESQGKPKFKDVISYGGQYKHRFV